MATKWPPKWKNGPQKWFWSIFPFQRPFFGDFQPGAIFHSLSHLPGFLRRAGFPFCKWPLRSQDERWPNMHALRCPSGSLPHQLGTSSSREPLWNQSAWSCLPCCTSQRRAGRWSKRFALPMLVRSFGLGGKHTHTMLHYQENVNLRGKNLGHSDLDRFTWTKVQNWISLFFQGKTARIQKKEGFIRTPPNRYGPSSSLSK